MQLKICEGATPWDLTDKCVRGAWTSIIPAALVFVICFFSISVHVPLPQAISRVIEAAKSPFYRFLNLHEAEALDQDAEKDGVDLQVPTDVPLWRTIVFSFVGITQCLYWVAFASYEYIDTQNEGLQWWNIVQPILTATAWLYTAVRPVGWPSQTPPYDMFAVYLALWIEASVQVGEIWYGWVLEGVLPEKWITIGFSVNWLLVMVVLVVILGMPLAVPSSRVKREDIGHSVSPEDYTSLFGWVTFHWVYPLVNRGRYNTLNESDVWALSPTIQSHPIFIKFSRLQQSSLLFRLWKANSLDLLLDFGLTFVSVMFNYAGPFFLKRILDLIDLPVQTPETRARAYIYAILAFICSLLKAQADVQHLWFGRRAATRIRSELMAAIYDKALKRKDFSGVIDKEKEKEREREKEKERKRAREQEEDAALAGDRKARKARAKKRKQEEAKAERERAAKADDPKAGADVGKIVNLMSGDANRISNMISGAYFIYGAPFEIIIAGTFLYQLLGWSAFSGFLVLIAGWPLNSYIARRSIRIQKGVLVARDKRMGVLNELIGAVKFIKFFAWEDRWIDRALDARAVELQWMVKARVNSVMFYLLWTCAPILVSIISFFTFVWQGKELTVSIAFTAIALFGMIRAPLNVIPAWIVQILQTGVALKRIAVYLDEDEVTPQVSSLKKDFSEPSVASDDGTEKGFGIINASFKWNAVEEDEKKKDAVIESAHSSPSTSTSTTSPPENTKGRSGLHGHSVESPSSVSTSMSSPTLEDGSSSAAGSTFDIIEAADHEFELRDVSIIFPEGKLTVVTGPTASGKTALLMALLGEMTMLPNSSPGKLLLSKNPSLIDEHGNMHAVSYAAQTPWLRHQSIKDNILFGYPYDEERYNQVVECCALIPDLEMLEDGDATEIGARGVSLSGGQKARVALARAVYARTRYVLLDDPLSAVDSHTARFLFDRLLRGPLLQNRTVILVTHHVDLVLPGAHYLVRMLDGRIDTQGTVEDLRDQGVLNAIVHDASTEVPQEEVTSSADHALETTDAQKGTQEDTPGAATGETKKPKKLIKDEHRETGGVKWAIYKSYLKASSYWIWVFLFFMIIVNQFLGITEKLWIMTWGSAYGSNEPTSPYAFTSFATPEHEVQMDGYLSSHQHSNSYQVIHATGKTVFGYPLPSAQEHPLFYIGVYASIGLISALASVMSITAQYTGALRASRILFKRLLVTVVHATFRFHDTTPQGRMLNRFGKDIETIDSSLAGSLQAVNSSLASFFASILTVAVVFPIFLLPACLIGFAYRELAVGYLNTGRDLRRMESNTRSPIFSDFGELLEGIVTVRAFSAERRFLDALHHKIDVTTQMWYTFWMTNRWLLLNFDALGAAAVLVTQLLSIATLSSGAGLAGLCITSAMAFTTSVYWACRFWTALELDLNSVERVVEYLDLPQEPPAIIESNRVPAYWPSSSAQGDLISVENLVVKYAPDLPAVLQGVSFGLKAGERIGLLGRTGSGKSTLAMSILRFVDPAEGRIVIDGIDISTIGIQDLRSRITFIPQDATLFSGTLRDNLDPFHEHTDSECLDVLQRVHMINPSSRELTPSSSHAPSRTASSHNLVIGDSPDSLRSRTPTETDSKTTITLDTQVSPGGTNFSQGQRQLISMARALLRRSPVIVLDEATSSIDFATDAKIQATIREEFTESLLLTVAHRLRTVIDYDRLIVLDKGKIVEFDTPWNLIRKENGIFRTMCLKSGTFGELEAAARSKAESA